MQGSFNFFQVWEREKYILTASVSSKLRQYNISCKLQNVAKPVNGISQNIVLVRQSRTITATPVLKSQVKLIKKGKRELRFDRSHHKLCEYDGSKIASFLLFSEVTLFNNNFLANCRMVTDTTQYDSWKILRTNTTPSTVLYFLKLTYR